MQHCRALLRVLDVSRRISKTVGVKITCLSMGSISYMGRAAFHKWFCLYSLIKFIVKMFIIAKYIWKDNIWNLVSQCLQGLSKSHGMICLIYASQHSPKYLCQGIISLTCCSVEYTGNGAKRRKNNLASRKIFTTFIE